MTTLLACLLIAIILPYLVKLPVGYAMQKAKGGYDNNHPREQQATLTGFGARAVAAHQNCFESLAVFSTAVLTALVTHHVSLSIQTLAVIYIISRFIYVFLYLINLAALRSIIWFIGVICCLSIMFLCLS
ncbi:membrane protein [Legionella antarctica]|uniref:Membrane protein n=1 Tax=Legionella antarctica TaxID=2708020 RepID=A0A6F8T2C0_9GAMM|nr:MAPEG family protein [Legionella antarctica]BCA94538.1 membrane protein [Legionella antarctica]